MEHPNSSQRDVESGEKSRCRVESFTGNQQIQEPDHEFLGESAPHTGFYPQLPPLPILGFQDPAELLFKANNSQCQCALEPWSCQAQPQGRQQENSFLRGVGSSSSPGHVPCAVSSSRGGFLSGINCLNPSAVLKNTGGREEDLLEQVISSAKHVILKLS